MLIAVFGALVASSMTGVAGCAAGSAQRMMEAEGFRLVFIGAALCFALALVAIARMEAKAVKTNTA